MKETLEKAAKDFIENSMKYSFNSMKTKSMANRLLKCVEFGAKWQAKRMISIEAYEDAISMQKTSNAGYESKIAELQQELDEVNAWFNRDKDLNDYYNDLSEPKYKGKGEHNINQLEAIIAEYQELVHKLKVRLQ